MRQFWWWGWAVLVIACGEPADDPVKADPETVVETDVTVDIDVSHLERRGGDAWHAGGMTKTVGR